MKRYAALGVLLAAWVAGFCLLDIDANFDIWE